MATITTSWVTYASKTFKPGTGLSVTFQLQARQTAQSVANNTSTIQTRLRSVINSGQGSGNNYKFTCSYASSVSGSGLWTLENETITTSSNKVISHNNDGTKTITLSATAVISGLSMNLSMSASVNLKKIDRLAIVSSGVDFIIDGSGGQSSVANNPTIKFSNPANYQLQPYLEIYNGSTKVATITRSKGSYTSPYNFNLTQAERDNFMQNNTTARQYNVREGITTYYGSSNLGSSYVTKKMDVVGHAEADYSYEDTNPTTIAITGDNQKIIQNQSTLQINLSNIVPYQNAPIVTAEAIYNSITYNGTISGDTATIPIGTIDSTSDVEVVARLIDTRGNIWFRYIPITILSWQIPTANITLQRQNNYYSETDIKVDANYSSLDGENTITIKERHKKTSEQNYSAYTTLTDNVTSTITLDNLYEWDVQVLVQDLLGSTTYNLTLDKGMPIIYFDRLKRSVSINSFPQNNESLEVLGGDILEIIGDKTDTWSSGGSYAKDSFVTYERYIYKNKTGSNSGTPDTDTTNWKKVSILELMKDIEAGGGGGTTNYNDLGNKPSINGVTLSGNKTTSDLGIVIPTTTSQLTNNSGFITNSVNNLTNYTLSSALSSVATSGSYNDLTNKPTIPTQTSQLTNNSGFITNSVNDLTNYTKTSDLGAVALSNDYDDLDNKPTIPTIPTNVSAFTNDAGYLTSITSSDVTTALGYTPQEEIKTFDITIIADKSLLVNIHNCISNNEEFKLYKLSQNGTYYYDIINTNINANTNSFDYVDENNNIIHNEITYTGSGNPSYTETTIGMQEEITSSNKLDYSLLDNTPTIPTSTSQLTNDSGYITSSYHDSTKQDTLVSGTNIKTINNTSLLGSGDITIGGGGTATDVQINGTSITSSGTANIITEGTYNSSTNKIATMSDIPTVPSNVSAFTNDIGYLTSVEINGHAVETGTVANIITNTAYDASTNKIATMSDLPQDSGWKNITTTRGTWVYCRYRIIGKKVYLEGRASSLSYSGSATKIGEMPSGTLPSTGENHYFYGHLAGGRIARVLINTSGEIIVDWARNLSDGNTYTTSTWYSFSTTYFID